jgi:hypothetical protein
MESAMNNPVPVEYISSFTQANQSLMLHLATELLGEAGAAATSSALPSSRTCSKTTSRRWARCG